MNDSKSVFASKIFWVNVVSAAVAVLTALIAQDWIAEYPKVFAGLTTALAIVNVVLRLLTTQAVHVVALFLAFALPLSACQAACRHITPMPTAYPADGAVILGTMNGEVDSFWSQPITVRYGNYDWPADNATGISGGKGWRCWASFARGRDTWTIHRAWEPSPVLFDRETGSRLP